MSCRKANLKDNGHGEEVDKEIENDVEVGVGPPDALFVAVDFSRELEFKVPECVEGHACGEDHDHNERIVDQDAGKQDVCGAPDPGEVPDANVEEHDGDLRAVETEAVEEESVPSCLGGVNKVREGGCGNGSYL